MARQRKVTLPREYYVNFAGLFPHPTEDIDLFIRLPEWRKREILTTEAAFKKDPTLQAFEIHDLRTGKPYPGQHFYKPPADLYQSIQGPPNSIKYNIPDGVTLTVARKYGARGLRDAVDEYERRELGYLF